MTEGTPSKPKPSKSKQRGITKIRVQGFKSIRQQTEIDIRPLTILAGANSSGKSSMIQPLLLLKQTLEVGYDPGALSLNGSNVKFTRTDQFLSRYGDGDTSFTIGLTVVGNTRRKYLSTDVDIEFSQQEKGNLIAVQQVLSNDEERIHLHTGMSQDDIANVIPANKKAQLTAQELSIMHNWFFLDVGCKETSKSAHIFASVTSPSVFAPFIWEIIHLPSLRGNPERTYPVVAEASLFSGTFEMNAASVIAHWNEESGDCKSDELESLEANLAQLGLAWKVEARVVGKTHIELLVGRLPKPTCEDDQDVVNIADVGFGVSQILPILVALEEARPGQMVYIEQPEIHLHPRTQTAMARILADAAKRGVRVVLETHSSLLLLAIQKHVAEGYLPPDIVKLHWCTRDEEGVTHITSTDLDETGAYGDWPEDFADVELETHGNYLRVAGERAWENIE